MRGSADQQTQEQIAKDLWAGYVVSRDPMLRERLILQYRPLVKFVVARLVHKLPAVVEFDDLVSAGMFGLIEAIERFDPDRGISFQLYAFPRIRGSVLDSLRSLQSGPRSIGKFTREHEQAKERLAEQLGRAPSDREIAMAMGLSPARYRSRLIQAQRITVSLDQEFASRDGETSAEDALADPNGVESGEDLEQEELRQALSVAIRRLCPRDQQVLRLYYQDGLTLGDIAKVLGVSESRVSQLRGRVVQQLRTTIGRHYPEAA